MTIERVGVLIVGVNGASANTLITGVLGAPSASASALGSLVAGAGLAESGLFVTESSLSFGGWDVDDRTAEDVARSYEIVPEPLIAGASVGLAELRPFPAYVSEFDTAEALDGQHTLPPGPPAKAVERICADIRLFRETRGVARCIVMYFASPSRAWGPEREVDKNALAELLRKAEPVPSGLVYAIAALRSGCAFVDLTPNVVLELPGVVAMAEECGLPIAGRDLSTGETMLKLVLGSMLRRRNLRLKGWYSANILGNSDGRVLARPEHRDTKMRDKLAVLPAILGYTDFDHVVDITYYPPRGDEKESWEAVDFTGWLDLPMSMRINWQGRDSVLAAPLALDLVKHLDFAVRRGHAGLMTHLGAYFKRPLGQVPMPLDEATDQLVAFYRPYIRQEVR